MQNFYVRDAPDEIVKGVYAARGPFEAVFVQHQSAGHDEAILSRTISGAFRVAVVPRSYSAMRKRKFFFIPK